MWKLTRVAILCVVCSSSWAGVTLTELEMKWLRAAWPVLIYAEAQGLPIDIIAQPESKPGAIPFAMGFQGDRCQLVLSMRGNPDAEKVLAGVPADQINAVIEAVTAHEVAHCWRYTHGTWHALPAGFTEVGLDRTDQRLAGIRQEMRETRREEGFADLVALAWILRGNPDQYAQVHAWFERIRKDQPVEGSFHDTRVWIQLASDRLAFDPDENPFEQARVLWAEGLLREG